MAKYQITLKESGDIATFRSKREVEAAVTVTAEQWTEVDAGESVILQTFLGEATLRRV